MTFGFAGTCNGMTDAQCEAFGRLLQVRRPAEFHHWACIVSDEQAVTFVAGMPFPRVIIAHPGKPANQMVLSH